MTHHVCSTYSENDHQMYPPLRTLGFNPKLKANDNLLAQSYVEAFDISYPERGLITMANTFSTTSEHLRLTMKETSSLHL